MLLVGWSAGIKAVGDSRYARDSSAKGKFFVEVSDVSAAALLFVERVNKPALLDPSHQRRIYNN